MNSERFLAMLFSHSCSAAVLAGMLLTIKYVLGRWISPRWQYGLWFLLVARLIVPDGPGSNMSVQHLLNWKLPTSTRTNHATAANDPRVTMPTFGTAVTAIDAQRTTAKTSHRFWNTRSLADLLVLTWAVGVLGVMALLAWNTRRLNWIIRLSTPVTDWRVTEEFQRCCSELGLENKLRFRQSGDISVPMVVGMLRPVVLLPLNMSTGLSLSDLRHALLHECMHVRRHDLVVSWFTTVVQAIHWFNPVLWVAFSQMRRDREIACDADAIRFLGESRAGEYGRALLKVAENLKSTARVWQALALVESKLDLRRRIEMIARYRVMNWRHGIVPSISSILLVGLNFTSAATEPNHVTDAAKPTPPSATVGSDHSTSASLISDKQPFTLTVAPQDGILNYTFGPNHELRGISARKGVVFSTRDTTITCDQLDYDPVRQELVTTGPGLSVMQGNREFTGRSYQLLIPENRGELIGDAIITQRDENGKGRTTTSGDRITIYGTTGSVQMKVHGGPSHRPFVATSSPAFL
jgi:bla regulator protein BlaR1